MVQMWVVIGLIVSAVAVSALGAAFSILGLGKLFAGAVISVSLMAGALELAKFTIAAYLHQAWNQVNILARVYMVSAIAILSIITSMGIFGFLSGAYQESSALLQVENIKIGSLKDEKNRIDQEIQRINRIVEEIPDSRITKKLKTRQEIEPMIQDLKKKQETVIDQITAADLVILDVTKKVGPLIYIGKLFGADVDNVVKYLILAFVFVFDPLAICLVLAVSHSMAHRKSPRATDALAGPQVVPFGGFRSPATQDADVYPLASGDASPSAGPPSSPPGNSSQASGQTSQMPGHSVQKPVVKMKFVKDPKGGST